MTILNKMSNLCKWNVSIKHTENANILKTKHSICWLILYYAFTYCLWLDRMGKVTSTTSLLCARFIFPPWNVFDMFQCIDKSHGLIVFNWKMLCLAKLTLMLASLFYSSGAYATRHYDKIIDVRKYYAVDRPLSVHGTFKILWTDYM